MLESASNAEDNTRFSIEEVMKYKQAADKPDPKKLTTKNKIKNCFNHFSYYTIV